MTPPIKNVRLRIRIAQRAKNPAHRPDRPEPPPLHLLGDGLDAIICKTIVPETHWLWRLLVPGGQVRKRLAAADTEQAARDRIDRYHTAMLLFSPWTLAEHERRMVIGAEVKLQVRTHRFGAESNVIPLAQWRAGGGRRG